MQAANSKHQWIWIHPHHSTGMSKPLTHFSSELDNSEEITSITQRLAICQIIQCKLSNIDRNAINPKETQTKRKGPRPRVTEWPKPEWPKELKDLCMEFEDVLVEAVESAQQVTCPPMDIEL